MPVLLLGEMRDVRLLHHEVGPVLVDPQRRLELPRDLRVVPPPGGVESARATERFGHSEGGLGPGAHGRLTEPGPHLGLLHVSHHGIQVHPERGEQPRRRAPLLAHERGHRARVQLHPDLREAGLEAGVVVDPRVRGVLRRELGEVRLKVASRHHLAEQVPGSERLGMENRGRVGSGKGRGEEQLSHHGTWRAHPSSRLGGDAGTGSHLLEVAKRLGYAHVIAQPTT